MSQSTRIRPVQHDDAISLVRIYNHYITHTNISFEEAEVSPVEMVKRMESVSSQNLPWLVEENSGRIEGFAYAAPWRTRAAYRYSVETSVYVDVECCGRGIGSRLMRELFHRLEKMPVHSITAGIALPNPASVTLHERLGMKQVAQLKEVGFKNGQWIDVGYWQLLLSGGLPE